MSKNLFEGKHTAINIFNQMKHNDHQQLFHVASDTEIIIVPAVNFGLFFYKYGDPQ